MALIYLKFITYGFHSKNRCSREDSYFHSLRASLVVFPLAEIHETAQKRRHRAYFVEDIFRLQSIFFGFFSPNLLKATSDSQSLSKSSVCAFEAWRKATKVSKIANLIDVFYLKIKVGEISILTMISNQSILLPHSRIMLNYLPRSSWMWKTYHISIDKVARKRLIFN